MTHTHYWNIQVGTICYWLYIRVIGPSHRFEIGGLRLLNTRQSDSGYYRCVADNQVGRSNVTARVRVEGN